MPQNRRSFIKSFSLTLGGIALSPSIPFHTKTYNEQITTRTKRKFGVALIGLGYYSTDLLAPALQETKNCYLAGIVTGSPEKEKIWADKYNLKRSNIYNYSNFDSIKNNPEIDFVYVVLPNSMHKEFTIRAAEAAKHVICEKPMAVTSKDCLDMINSCRKENRKLSIGYRLHYDVTTQKIIKWATEKPYGDIKYIHAAAGFTFSKSMSGHWKQQKKYGGGALMDMGVYSIQAARYSTGLEPTAVIAAQDITFDHELYMGVDQAITFQLEFPNNITANLMTSFACSINDLNVTASRGWYNLKPFSAYRGVKGESKDGPLDYPSINQQAAHMDDFALTIENDAKPLISGEEGYRDLVIVEAVKQSLRSGKRVNL